MHRQTDNYRLLLIELLSEQKIITFNIIFSILCLIDGWSFGVNDVQFLDFVPKTEVPTSVRISGTAEIYFAGFISIDLDFTQVFPLSTNVTFSCPEGTLLLNIT